MSYKSRIPGALTKAGRVTIALVLRDIKTRFGSSYFGFFFGLAIPLGHIGVVLLAYVLFGRRAPIGTDVTLYLTTAVLPFVIWSYTHQKMMRALPENLPLLSLPVVRMIDIVVARAIVELLNATLIVVVVMFSLDFLGVDTFIASPKEAFLALTLSYMLGVATGLVFGFLTLVVPGLLLVGVLLIPIYWITSGVLFIPDALPPQLKAALWVFPLPHIVDFLRMSVYPQYASDFPSLAYVTAVIFGNILVSMLALHFGKAALTSS